MIYAIFGTKESGTADVMVGQGKVLKILAKDLPRSAQYNDRGVRASFGVSVPPTSMAEFAHLILTPRRNKDV